MIPKKQNLIFYAKLLLELKRMQIINLQRNILVLMEAQQ